MILSSRYLYFPHPSKPCTPYSATQSPLLHLPFLTSSHLRTYSSSHRSYSHFQTFYIYIYKLLLLQLAQLIHLFHPPALVSRTWPLPKRDAEGEGVEVPVEQVTDQPRTKATETVMEMPLNLRLGGGEGLARMETKVRRGVVLGVVRWGEVWWGEVWWGEVRWSGVRWG